MQDEIAKFKERYNVNPETLVSNVINVSSVSKKNPYGYTPEEVRSRVEYIMAKLNDPKSFKFFCKVAWNLPEAVIYRELENALTKGKNPAAYFSKVCKIKLGQ